MKSILKLRKLTIGVFLLILVNFTIPNFLTPSNYDANGNEQLAPEGSATEYVWSTYLGGPAHQGYSPTTVPLTPTLRWHFTGFDSTPVADGVIVANGYVYLTDKYNIYCLDEMTGAVVWSNYYSEGIIWFSPSWHDGYLVFTIADDFYYPDEDRIVCLDASNGNQIWNHGVEYINDLSININDGKFILFTYYDDPVYDELIRVECRHVNDYSLVWQYTFSDSYWIDWHWYYTIANDKVYINDGYDDTIICLSFIDGSFQWQTTMMNDAFGIYNTLLATDNYLLVLTRDNPICLNALTGAVIWQNPNVYPVDAPPAYDGTYFYFHARDYDNDDYIYCLQPSTGSIQWQYEVTGLYADDMIPAVNDEYLVFNGMYDDMMCIRKSDQSLMWTIETDEVPRNTVLCNGAMYFEYYNGIACFEEYQDRDPPLITSVSHTPVSPTELNTIVVSADVTDDSGVDSVTVHYRVDGGGWFTFPMVHTTGSEYLVDIGTFAQGSFIQYYITAIDSSSNSNVATQDNSGGYYSISVGDSDTTGPDITDVTHTPVTPTELNSIVISASITDVSGVAIATTHYRINGGSWNTEAMVHTTGSTYDAVIGSFSPGDYIEYYITSLDGSLNSNEGNSGIYGEINIGDSDTTGPSISSVTHVPLSPTDLNFIVISASISDLSGVASATAYYCINGGTWLTSSMGLTTGTTYETSIGPFNPGDFIEYYIFAVDASLNSNPAMDDNSGSYYSVSIGDSDLTGPLITSVTHSPLSPTELDSLTISASITDSSGVASATLHYRVNGGSWSTTSIIFDTGSTYEANIGQFTIGDVIEYYVSAIDSSLNSNGATNDNSGSYYNVGIGDSDISGPAITSITHSPSTPTELDSITISASITDSTGVASATLHYRVNSGSWLTTSIIFDTGSTYEANIGQFTIGDVIEYYVSAIDSSLNSNGATNDNSGSYYSVGIGDSDVSGPAITSITHSPSTPTELDSITISASITDSTGVASATLHYRINSASWLTASMSFVTGTTYEVDIGPFTQGDNVEFYILSIDTSLNANEGINDNSGSYYVFSIEDSDHIGPFIIHLSTTPVSPTELDSVIINADISDASGISNVELYYRVNAGIWQTASMTYDSEIRYTANIGTFSTLDVIEYYVVATDASLNLNEATDDNEGIYYSVIVGDSDITPPNISSISHSPPYPTETDVITIITSVSDSSGIDSVSVHYRVDGGSWVKELMDYNSGTIYYIIIGPYASGTEIQYYISAIDSSLNFNEAIDDDVGVFYSITVGDSDTTPPVFTDVSHLPTTPIESDSIVITATISDVSGISEVMLYYRINDGGWNSVFMLDISGVYQINLGSFSKGTSIEYYITATDNSLNRNMAIEDNGGSYYEIQIGDSDVNPPIITDVSHSPTNPTDLHSITISALASDPSGIHEVSVIYRVDTGDWETIEMSYTSGEYQVDIGTFIGGSSIEYYIIATDDSYNLNVATEDNSALYFHILIEDSDVEGPLITNIEHNPPSPSEIEEVIISATVTDDSGLDSVLLYYRINEDTWTTVAMMNTHDSNYEFNIGTFAIGDEIEYYVVATDDSANNNENIDDNGGVYYQITVIEGSDTETPTIDGFPYAIILFSVISSISILIFKIRQKLRKTVKKN